MIALSEKQLTKWLTINKTIDGTMTVAEAASALGLSSRQIQRLKKDVINNGSDPQGFSQKATTRY